MVDDGWSEKVKAWLGVSAGGGTSGTTDLAGGIKDQKQEADRPRVGTGNKRRRLKIKM